MLKACDSEEDWPTNKAQQKCSPNYITHETRSDSPGGNGENDNSSENQITSYTSMYAISEGSVELVVGGVFGGVIGLTVVTVIVIIVLTMIKKHQQTGKYDANGKSNDNAQGYINAVYACDGKAHDFSSHGCLFM